MGDDSKSTKSDTIMGYSKRYTLNSGSGEPDREKLRSGREDSGSTKSGDEASESIRARLNSAIQAPKRPELLGGEKRMPSQQIKIPCESFGSKYTK